MNYPRHNTKNKQNRLQYRPFVGGGFCVHKIILLRKKGSFSAYYDAKKNLVDAEQKISFSCVKPVKKGGPIWVSLQSLAEHFAMESRGLGPVR